MSHIIFKNHIGYIKGYLRKDSFWWVEEFVVYKKHRGKGLAKTLAKKIPAKCKLMAYPLTSKGCKLSTDALVRFYRSCGFRLYRDDWGNAMMKRLRKVA